MPSNLLASLLSPRYPSFAIGLEKDHASAVQLDRARGGYVIKRAASVALPGGLIQPSFDQTNIADTEELVRALSDLLTGAGLLRQRKWSVALPENSTRTAILTLEGASSSKREQEEMLEWKTERAFGAPSAELQLARELLPFDARKQKRYLTSAVRLSVLAEFEFVFAQMNWQAGLVLPRHVGEQQWLGNGRNGDGLLLTSHEAGFTAVLVRHNQPFVVRSIVCDPEECDDELHRVLLFYRDRAGAGGDAGDSNIDRVLVLGDRLDRVRVSQIAQETLGSSLRPLDADGAGLVIPGHDISFDTIAAPAGLAKMAW